MGGKCDLFVFQNRFGPTSSCGIPGRSGRRTVYPAGRRMDVHAGESGSTAQRDGARATEVTGMVIIYPVLRCQKT